MNRVTKGRQRKHAASRPTQTGKNAGSIRIIGGQWRGRKLPVHDVEGLRPTTDRNKETLFNWLMASVHGAHCLDLFAGSGGLGLEALSRYAQHCTFVEKDAAAAGVLQNNINTLAAQATIINGDALTVDLRSSAPFDIIFVDPPFGQGLAQQALDLIQLQQLLKPNGMIYLEQEITAPLPELPADWQWHKQKQTSSLVYGLIVQQE